VKLAEFNALCDREWAKQDRGGHGDVVSLCLTGPSAAELSTDILTRGVYLLCTDGTLVKAGVAVNGVINPVTRSMVKIRTKPDGKRETARVRVPGGYRQTWWPVSAQAA